MRAVARAGPRTPTVLRWALLPVLLFPVDQRAPHAQAGGPQSSHEACDESDAHVWLQDLRDRTLSSNELAHYAIAHHGPLLACSGAVTAEFDGRAFGTLRLEFGDGVTLEIDTSPPEVAVVVLIAPSGFGDETVVREVLERQVARMGLRVDWSSPTEERSAEERMETFLGPRSRTERLGPTDLRRRRAGLGGIQRGSVSLVTTWA